MTIAPSNDTVADEVTVKRSPKPGWIEVYYDDVLTSEWRREDGAVYVVLEMLLNDELYTPDRFHRGRRAGALLASL